MRVARRYVIAGRVQGVGFRWFAHDAAAREGIHGWVRNMADGSVEAMAEGELTAVDRLEAANRPAPAPARAADTATAAQPPSGRGPGGARREGASGQLG